MNWPVIKDVTSLDDAKTLFRLANTQFKQALTFFVLDGYVTEHVQIKQHISSLYKHLAKLELDQSRVEMMTKRRAESLEALQGQLNPQAYEVRMLEFAAELAEVYSDLYELCLKKPKKTIKEINALAEKSIKNSTFFTTAIHAKDDPADKFEYFQSMLNLELGVASKLTKWFTSDPQERI